MLFWFNWMYCLYATSTVAINILFFYTKMSKWLWIYLINKFIYSNILNAFQIKNQICGKIFLLKPLELNIQVT